MSIEASAPTPAPRSGSSGESRHAKSPGRAQSGDASPQGFLAALSAVDEVVGAATPVVAHDSVPNEPPAPVDIAQAATDLIANLMQLPAPLTGDSAVPLPLVVATDALATGGESSGASEVASAAASATTGATFNPPGTATGQRQSGLPPARALGAAVRSDGAPPTEVEALRPVKPQGGVLAVSAGVTDAAKAHDQKFLAALDAMKSVQMARDPALPAVNAPAVVLSAGLMLGDKYPKRDTASDFSNMVQASNVGLSGFAGTLATEIAATVPAGQVAEQVAFWISTDVHKAELKLEGLGENAVEVSIRMSGNEAHVTFRTDELQARGALEGAANHLKELLQREGLVLSGVSIGSSSGGNAGGQDRKPPQQGRQTAQVAVPVAGLERSHAVPGAAGRTLDLFV